MAVAPFGESRTPLWIQKNLRPAVKHGGDSVMVWGCVASNGITGSQSFNRFWFSTYSFRALCIANVDFRGMALLCKEIIKNLTRLAVSSIVRLGNTRPLPWHSRLGSICAKKHLRSGVRPPTTESNKGGSVPVIWQNQARRLPEVHPEHSATASGRGSNG
ncbi:hypothetical protein TNCV_4771251 [Trichonephila clavipes]|nr:hypothetical protein TNCV_4771251 [Trichonephila clavipes]